LNPASERRIRRLLCAQPCSTFLTVIACLFARARLLSVKPVVPASSFIAEVQASLSSSFLYAEKDKARIGLCASQILTLMASWLDLDTLLHLLLPCQFILDQWYH
jgi:hypothetical protein